MATKKRKAKSKSKTGFQINWGVIGFIAVVILAICAWQISAKPQAGATESYRWSTVVRGLGASINKLNGEVSANWTEVMLAAPFQLDGYRLVIKPRGGAAEIYDLSISQTNTNLPKGATYPQRYATVKSAGALKATSAVVSVYPMIEHPVHNPSSNAIEAAGNSANALLNM
jgi:hypothetical protein